MLDVKVVKRCFIYYYYDIILVVLYLKQNKLRNIL